MTKEKRYATFREAWHGDVPADELARRFGLKGRPGVWGMAGMLGLGFRAIDAADSDRRLAEARATREQGRASRDDLFRRLWLADVPLETLRARFGMQSGRGVKKKASDMGLTARACDAPPPRPKKLPMRIRASIEEREAAAARMAALATPDRLRAARLFLQRKGVVIYAATVVDGSAGEGLLKVDGRNMTADAMVAKAVRLGFDAATESPLLRWPGAPATGVQAAP